MNYKKKREVFIAIGITGIVFYIVLITSLSFLWDGYNPITQTISELGASDSPFREIINYFGFSTLGIAIMIFSLGFKYELKETYHTEISFFCLFVGGFFMFLVGFFPCDARCLDITLIGRLHFYVSAIPATLIPLAAIISSDEISKKWSSKWGNFSLYSGIFSLIAGPTMLFAIITPYIGLVQRTGMGITVLWIIVISTKFFNDNIEKMYNIKNKKLNLNN